jgi:ADP-ribosyl-[dinitrogen reductase] hydrolase
MTPEQACWGIEGLLVGDALGVPYEFTKPDKMPARELIEYEPPAGFRKAWPNVPPGTWSDDGAQALCVLDAVMCDKNAYIEEEVGSRLLRWRDEGFMAVDGRVFDIGNTTNAALSRLASGVPARQAGMVGEYTKANGSLMRTLPIAFMKGATDDEIARAAIGQSRVTHAETEPMLCCALYCLWARHMAENRLKAEKSWDLAFETLFRVVPKGVLSAHIIRIERWPGGTPSGSGYCIDSLHSAKWALDQGTDYESVLKAAISLGNDTDTTAAIVGGLAGIKYQAIPQRWRDGLRGRDILNPLLDNLRIR